MADSEWWLLLPAPVRRLPADLAAVLTLVGLTLLAVFLPVISESPLRVIFGLPFVLFVPGYAFIAALFPEAGESPTDSGAGDEADTPQTTDRGIDGIERVALSFGLSIAITPLIGLVLNFTPWGIRLVPIMLSVAGFTVVATAVAARRRWDLPEEDRFEVPYREWAAAGRAELFEPETRTDAALNVLLVVSVVLATASVGYAIAVPKQGESFTEFYALTENESGGLVADGYPTQFTSDESEQVVLGIGNHEHERTDYTVVVELHRVEFVNGSNPTRQIDAANQSINTSQVRVIEEAELRRFGTTLAADGTWLQPYNVTPTMTGTNLRLTFLLYEGTTPADPTVENAYRQLHLWVNVSTSR